MIIKQTVPGLADSLVIPLENKVNELNTEIVDLNKEYQEQINDLNQSYQTQIDDINKSYQEQINNINTAHRIEVNNLNNTISVKDAEISNLTESVNVKNIQISELTEDVEELTNTNEQLNTNIAITNLQLREIAGEDTPIPVQVISDSKEDIKESLSKKGANPTDVLSSYSSLIDNLSTGNADVIIYSEYEGDKNNIQFPESCTYPILISDTFTQKEWSFPNAKQLVNFPSSDFVGGYTLGLITVNIPNCEKISKFYPAQKLKFITSNKLKSLNHAFYRGGENGSKDMYELEFTDLTGVTDISYMFNNVYSFPTNLTLSLPNLENASNAFAQGFGSSKKHSVTLNDIEKPIKADHMFAATNLNVYTNNPLRVLDATQMFYDNDIDEFPTIIFEKDCGAVQMFYNCTGLKNIDFLQNTENISEMNGMFSQTRIQNIPESFSYANSKSLNSMYSNTTMLKYLSKINNITGSWSNMFWGSSIVRVDEIQAADNNDYSAGLSAYKLNHSYTTEYLRYILIKGLGSTEDETNWNGVIYNPSADFSGWRVWGIEDSNEPLSIGARQSLTDSLITYSIDRVEKGFKGIYTITLYSSVKALLTDEEIAQITAKGFTIA